LRRRTVSSRVLRRRALRRRTVSSRAVSSRALRRPCPGRWSPARRGRGV